MANNNKKKKKSSSTSTSSSSSSTSVLPATTPDEKMKTPVDTKKSIGGKRSINEVDAEVESKSPKKTTPSSKLIPQKLQQQKKSRGRRSQAYVDVMTTLGECVDKDDNELLCELKNILPDDQLKLMKLKDSLDDENVYEMRKEDHLKNVKKIIADLKDCSTIYDDQKIKNVLNDIKNFGEDVERDHHDKLRQYFQLMADHFDLVTKFLYVKRLSYVKEIIEQKISRSGAFAYLKDEEEEEEGGVDPDISSLDKELFGLK